MNTGKISYKIAFSGLMAALSVVILCLNNFIPILTYATPLFAALLLIPVMDEFGSKWGWMTWVCVSALAVILSADKEVAAFYIFVGYYPMLKPVLDRIQPKPLSIISKIAVFSIAVAAMYLILVFLFRIDAVLNEFKTAGLIMNIITYCMMIFILMIFDKLVERMRILYLKKIKTKIKINFRVIAFLLVFGFMLLGRTDRAYARTKAVTYFGNEWPVNFLNSEHAQAEADFARIKADGFNTVIYCVPWREIQPDNAGGFNEAALRKLDEMVSRAEGSGLAVMFRLGYTWDYGDTTSSIGRFNNLFKYQHDRNSWLEYASRIYQLASAHSNFAGAFITWEDFWTSLAADYSGFETMDKELLRLLEQTQAVFPGLSMECRLHVDSSGGRPVYHDGTFGCANAPYSSAMLAVSMGFPDGAVVDPASAAQMSSNMISRVQAAGKPVFIDQFLYMETTPGYERLANVSDVNAYLAAMGNVFNNQTMGYGIWTYRDYANSIIYNPEFGQGEKGWRFSGASYQNVNGNGKAYLDAGGSVSQNTAGRGFSDSFSTKFQATVDAESDGKINVTVSGESRSMDIHPGNQTVSIDFGHQVKGDIRISTTVPAYLDDVKLYSHVTEGNIYKLDGTPGTYLGGIRTMNSIIK